MINPTSRKGSPLAVLSAALFVCAFVLAPASYAADTPSHPCKDIKTACTGGGYLPHTHKKTGKGLYVDCMKKIMNGETVEGVSVTADTVSACKARKEKRHERKNAHAAAKPTT
jgi:hypothetical protein